MIYLDHAATTPVPEEVAHAVYDLSLIHISEPTRH